MTNPNEYGLISSRSSARNVNLTALNSDELTPIIGKLVYFDITVAGETYRAIGTVSSVTTENPNLTTAYETMSTRFRDGGSSLGNDLRRSEFAIQAVFRKGADQAWVQYGSSLPTSPDTRTMVSLVTEDTINEMVQSSDLPSVGYLRGLESAPGSLTLRDFGGSSGSTHSAVTGRSGSGKAVDINTPIPTPSGWTTMGALKAGDEIFDAQGKVCRVTVTHPISYREHSYEVVFSDGSVVLADADHLWYTETAASRHSKSATKITRVNAAREAWHSGEVTSHLRMLASETPVSDKATLNEIVRLVSSIVGHDSSTLVASAISDLPVVGYSSESISAAYTSASFTKKQKMRVYSGRALTEALTASSSPKALAVLESIQKEPLDKEWSVNDLRQLQGFPKGGSSRRFLDMLEVDYVETHRDCVIPPITYKAAKVTRGYPSPQYSLKSALTKVAEHGSRIRCDQRERVITGSVKTTQEIKDTLTHETASRRVWNHSVPVAKALQLPEADLPIHPYTLGAWLGDGDSWNGSICGVDEEIKDYISTHENRPVTITKLREGTSVYTWTFENLRTDLVKLGLMKTKATRDKHFKHIPQQYLRASISQRQELLAGLLDTDGNATTSASVEFTNTNRALAYGVHELALSLGYRATITERRATLYGVDKGPKWTVRFSTQDEVFRLSRKQIVHAEGRTSYNEDKNSQRYIVAVNPIEPVKMRCITVDSPDSLYLAGESFIPTHNTQAYSMVLGGYMQHEHHAVLVIDPQGQWATENGMIFSLQGFAKGLGREVSVVRVAEDIKLTMDVDILSRMIRKVNMWARFRRMGAENKEAFADEVALRLSRHSNLDKDSRELMSGIFSEIASSPASLSRIYTKGDRQDDFKRELQLMAGDPIVDEDGIEEEIDAEVLEDIETRWDSILSIFRPLHSLFSSTNLAGTKRKPLGGSQGFLTNIFKVRRSSDAPAPYVILDMSPNTVLHAKASLDRNNEEYGMQKLLDNQDVKALILMMVLDEMKKASEVAFQAGGGNLNTQIVFDEAWRYAPASKASPEIDELADMLEGFALDTRKFGIGWTYILQSPADLRYGIWRQLTFVYCGYGLVGEDVKRLEGLTDDPKQIDLYRQFISPAATGIYPFMIMGPASPLIFTTAPMFINAYSGTTEFLEHNRKWIDAITNRRQLPLVNKEYMEQVQRQMRADLRKSSSAASAPKTHQVGKVVKPSEPQYTPPVKPDQAQKMQEFVDKHNLPRDFLSGNGAKPVDTIDDTPF